jgi:hypothetical protein
MPHFVPDNMPGNFQRQCEWKPHSEFFLDQGVVMSFRIELPLRFAHLREVPARVAPWGDRPSIARAKERMRVTRLGLP